MLLIGVGVNPMTRKSLPLWRHFLHVVLTHSDDVSSAADASDVIPGRRFSSSTAVRIAIQNFFFILIPSLR